jgi:hypothetical protein
MPSTPQQVLRRERVEGLIALAAPFLDLLLSAGDRISKVVGPEDEYYPIRSAGESFSLPGSEPDDAADPEFARSVPDDA